MFLYFDLIKDLYSDLKSHWFLDIELIKDLKYGSFRLSPHMKSLKGKVGGKCGSRDSFVALGVHCFLLRGQKCSNVLKYLIKWIGIANGFTPDKFAQVRVKKGPVHDPPLLQECQR